MNQRESLVHRSDFEQRVRGEITAEEYVARLDARVEAARAQHTDGDYKLHAGLRAKIDAAREALLVVLRPDASWTCRHCDQPMPDPGDGWLEPRTVYEQANPPDPRYSWKTPHEGTSLTLAMHRLHDEGLVEWDKRWRVRLTKKGRRVA